MTSTKETSRIASDISCSAEKPPLNQNYSDIKETTIIDHFNRTSV
jgi:hypothetical protein